MPYRLKAGESIPEGIKRIVTEEVDAAVEQLNDHSGAHRDAAIHEARKSVKKIRGVLRLVQPELGRAYRDENAKLRDIGQQLSAVRDAGAIIQMFDGLLDKHKDNLQKNGLRSIRRALEQEKREVERALDVDKVAQRAAAALRATKQRLRKWPLKRDGFPAIAAGLKLRYRRGRKAMAVAQKDPAPENLHEWRKRVKDHWYQMRLLESVWTKVMQAHEQSLHDLETWLGDDHNLVVLQQKLEHEPEKYGAEKDIDLFLTLADQHKKVLREQAISLGQRVYEQKPKLFVRNMRNLWDAWQQQPDSMKQEQKAERAVVKKRPQQAARAKPNKAAVA